MAEYRIIKSAFWCDNYIVDLKPIEKLVFLYLLTNQNAHICGVYQINLKYVQLDLSLEKEELLDILKKFEEDDRIKYYNGWVAIKKWIKNQQQSPMVRTGILKGLKTIPEWALEFIEIPYGYPITSKPELESESELESKSKSKLKRTSEDVQPAKPAKKSKSEDLEDPAPEDPEDSSQEEEWHGKENVAISKMIEDLREELSLTDFKEDRSRKRLRGLHLVQLREKVGEKEFKRRLKILFSDSYKREKCNSLEFIYSEMRAYVDQEAEKAKREKKRMDAERMEREAEEDLRNRKKQEAEQMWKIFDNLPEEERWSIKEEAAASLAKMGRTEESEKAKGSAFAKSYENMMKGAMLNVTKRRYEASLSVSQ